MTRRPLMLIAALAAPALLGTALAGPPPAVPVQLTVSGRTATIGLPYRSADQLVWVSSTRVAEASPFMFKGLVIKPHEGPGGTDLAVFTYTADQPGTAKLSFGLVPPGKMLIGPPALVYTGPVAQRVTVEVVAK